MIGSINSSTSYSFMIKYHIISKGTFNNILHISGIFFRNVFLIWGLTLQYAEINLLHKYPLKYYAHKGKKDLCSFFPLNTTVRLQD